MVTKEGENFLDLDKVCIVCGEKISSKRTTEHFQLKHPQYEFKRKKVLYRSGKISSKYICSTCGSSCSGFPLLVSHYYKQHSIGTQPNIENPKTDYSIESIAGIIAGLSELVEGLRVERDDLKKENQVLKNQVLIADTKYRESLNEKINLSSQLIRAQELLALENKRRY